MKILLIITNIPSPYRVDFFYYLQQHETGWDIHILFQAGNDISFRQWIGGEDKLRNVHFLRSKVIRRSGFDVTEKFLPSGTGKMISTIDPDVIVAMEYNPAALAAKHWCRMHHVPYISWSDGTRFSERNIRLYQRLCRKYIIKNTAAFIASSTKAKENQIYLGAPADRIFISELSIDMTKYADAGLNYDPDGPLIYVGGLIKRKGVDLLLDAISLIKTGNWTLNIVGSGPEKENLQQQAQMLGLSDKVTFCGFVGGTELMALYKKSSLFILPTREDCFGLVTLEAMCCGLPVISSKYADSAYDLIEDTNGVIVDPYDRAAFSGAITSMTADKAKMRGMSCSSMKKAKEFGFGITSKGFMEAVNESTERKETRR